MACFCNSNAVLITGMMEIKRETGVLGSSGKYLEWVGVVTAIAYSLLVALNIGEEFIGFLLLLISATAIGLWAYLGRHRGILFLQFFYALAGIIGMLRWF